MKGSMYSTATEDSITHDRVSGAIDFKPIPTAPILANSFSVSKELVPVTSMKDGTTIQEVDIEHRTYAPVSLTGSAINGLWTQVNEDDRAEVGDTIRLTYRLNIPFFKEWQKDLIVSRLRGDERFSIVNVDYLPEQNRVLITAKLLQPMSPVLLIAAAIAAVLVGLGVYLTLESVEKLVVTTTSLDIGGFHLNFAGLIFLGIVLIFLLPKMRF